MAQVRVPTGISAAAPSVIISVGKATLLPVALSELTLAVTGEVTLTEAKAWPVSKAIVVIATAAAEAIFLNLSLIILSFLEPVSKLAFLTKFQNFGRIGANKF